MRAPVLEVKGSLCPLRRAQTYRKAPRKALAHTALSDIRESIEELKFWRKAIFKDPRQAK